MISSAGMAEQVCHCPTDSYDQSPSGVMTGGNHVPECRKEISTCSSTTATGCSTYTKAPVVVDPICEDVPKQASATCKCGTYVDLALGYCDVTTAAGNLSSGTSTTRYPLGKEICSAPPAQTASSGDCPELTAFRNKAAACKTKSASAVSQCSPDNAGKNSNNDTITMIQKGLGGFGQISQAMGQKNASGAQSCFQAAAIASGGWQALDLMKTDCASEISSCTSECDGADQMYPVVAQACNANYAAANPESTARDRDFYTTQLGNEIADLYNQLSAGKQACSIDAKSNQANLGKLAKDMSSSAQQAAKCECQLTAGQTNCDQIQGPEYCNQNPGDPNCPKAITMKCSGADANTKECICLRDPKGTACLGNTAGVSQIAGGTGANFNPLTGGGVNFKPSGAGVTGGLDGLNDLSSSSGMSGDKSAGGPELPGGVASGGGGGGAGGGGGGPEGLSPEGTPAEGESKSLAGGLFNYAKTVASQLFGGGSAGPRTSVPSKNFGSKAARPGIDPNKWRPVGLRGVAGSDGSGFGGKSMNIFDMVNNQYNNQYHTLMIAPVQ